MEMKKIPCIVSIAGRTMLSSDCRGYNRMVEMQQAVTISFEHEAYDNEKYNRMVEMQQAVTSQWVIMGNNK